MLLEFGMTGRQEEMSLGIMQCVGKLRRIFTSRKNKV